jgi:hypothetical protein
VSGPSTVVRNGDDAAHPRLGMWPWYSRRMRIDVSPESGTTFRVVVTDDEGTSTHMVTVWPSDVDRYAPGSTPEELLEAAFAFLLAREPKESILPRFEVSLIERYFPEFATAMGNGG